MAWLNSIRITYSKMLTETDKPHLGWRDWKTFAVLFLASVLATFIGLGVTPLMNPSEGFYAEGAREMLESANYIVPHLNYQPWLEKPPLVFWTTAFVYKLLGVNDFASRVPSAAAATILVVLLFLSARTFVSYRAALLSSLVLLSSSLFLIVGRLAITDMLFALFVSASILSVAQGVESKRRVLTWLGYLAAALAVLTKGPLALLIIASTLALYAMFALKRSDWKHFDPLIGLAIVSVVAIPWYILIHFSTAGAFTEEFFLGQNIARVFGHQRISAHSQPAWFYLPVYLGALFPWSILFFGFIASTGRRFISKAEKRRKLELLSIFWLVSAMVPISCACGKLPTYIVPSIPAFALIVGSNLDRLARIKSHNPTAYLALFSGLATVFLTPLFCEKMGFKELNSTSIVVLAAIALFAVAQLAFSRSIFLSRNSGAAVYGLAISSALAVSLIVPLAMHSYHHRHQHELKTAIDYATTRKSAAVVSLYQNLPIAQYYLKRPVKVIDHPDELLEIARAHEGKRIYLFSQEPLGGELSKHYQYYEGVEGKRWTLYALKLNQTRRSCNKKLALSSKAQP